MNRIIEIVEKLIDADPIMIVIDAFMGLAVLAGFGALVLLFKAML